MGESKAPLYAHSDPQRPWETLDAHAASVAKLAASHAAAFGAGDWGYLLGHWHDLGKASDDFQRYLRASADPDAAEDEQAPGRVDHSTFVARHAAAAIPNVLGQLLAFCVAGHHPGLADATPAAAAAHGRLPPEMEEM